MSSLDFYVQVLNWVIMEKDYRVKNNTYYDLLTHTPCHENLGFKIIHLRVTTGDKRVLDFINDGVRIIELYDKNIKKITDYLNLDTGKNNKLSYAKTKIGKTGKIDSTYRISSINATTIDTIVAYLNLRNPKPIISPNTDQNINEKNRLGINILNVSNSSSNSSSNFSSNSNSSSGSNSSSNCNSSSSMNNYSYRPPTPRPMNISNIDSIKWDNLDYYDKIKYIDLFHSNNNGRFLNIDKLTEVLPSMWKSFKYFTKTYSLVSNDEDSFTKIKNLLTERDTILINMADDININNEILYFNLDSKEYVESSFLCLYRFNDDDFKIISNNYFLFTHIRDKLKTKYGINVHNSLNNAANHDVGSSSSIILTNTLVPVHSIPSINNISLAVPIPISPIAPIVPIAPIAPARRKKLTDDDKFKVWDRYSRGGDTFLGLCYCCNKAINYKEKGTWEMGHIIPHSKGGSENVDNLRPICFSCNRAMKDMNMDDYINEYHPHNIQ